MAIDATTLIFFDASCLIAAAGSPTGGSSLLLAICARGLLRGAASQLVLAEAEGNILANLSPSAYVRYRQQILVLPLEVAPIPTSDAIEAAAPIAGGKDAHVLAAALALDAAFLITLDRPLLAGVNGAVLPLRARLPGDFIREELPTHPAYPHVRS